MRVVEHCVHGKHSDPAECEDGVFAGEHFVAVVDGSTDKSGKRFADRTPGRVARDLILEGLEDADPECGPNELIEMMDRRISDWYAQNNIVNRMEREPASRASASIAVYSAHRREVWMVGDCLARTENDLIQNDKRIDHLLAELRAFVLESRVFDGANEAELLRNDEGRAAVAPFLVLQSRFQNRELSSDFNYHVLDGFLPAKRGIRIERIPDDCRQLVLASDGYPDPRMTLAESERVLGKLLEQDPLLFRSLRSTKGAYPGQRSFDDRAYIRIEIP